MFHSRFIGSENILNGSIVIQVATHLSCFSIELLGTSNLKVAFNSRSRNSSTNVNQ